MTAKTWDIFVCHASEDKDSFVRPLAEALACLGLHVWYDEFSLKVGDSLSASIDKGLAGSAFGIVVLSPAFIGKPWPEHELRGLVTRDVHEGNVILPIWHGVTLEDVVRFSPPLADKMAIETSTTQPADAALRILQVVRPDLYDKHPRAELLRMANGEALRALQDEVERVRDELASAQEELSGYRCPYCGSPLAQRASAPVDPEEKHWDDREGYVCGYGTFAGRVERPCPSDPRFPKFEDFEVHFTKEGTAPASRWHCYAIGKTDMARRFSLGSGFGRTKDEAQRSLREAYDRAAKKWTP